MSDRVFERYFLGGLSLLTLGLTAFLTYWAVYHDVEIAGGAVVLGFISVMVVWVTIVTLLDTEKKHRIATRPIKVWLK